MDTCTLYSPDFLLSRFKALYQMDSSPLGMVAQSSLFAVHPMVEVNLYGKSTQGNRILLR